jgi:hypothetical protein
VKCNKCGKEMHHKWIKRVRAGRVKSGRDAEAPHICQACFTAAIHRLMTEEVGDE